MYYSHADKVDLIIPIALKDIESLKKNLPWIKKYIGTNHIFIIGNSKACDKLYLLEGVSCINEDEIYQGLTFDKIKNNIRSVLPKAERRTGWYFQQFIKLGYSQICTAPYYMSWDSDTIPVKRLQFFDENSKPFFDYIPMVNEDKPYFDFLEIISDNTDFTKKRQESFVAEHMVFNTQVVMDMLRRIETNQDLTGNSFYEKIINAIPRKNLNLSGFSEFETYASFVDNNYPNMYSFRRWHNLRNGKFYLGSSPTNEVLSWVSKKFDVVSLEDYDLQFFLFKLFVNRMKIYRFIAFSKIYAICNPFYRVYYKLRLKIRRCLKS